MSCINQVILIALFSYCIHIVCGTPLLKGFNVHKEFDANLKGIEIKPIQIYRQIWSPFGILGDRKGIQKRDVINVERLAASPAPVHEVVDEHLKEAVVIKEIYPGPETAEKKVQGLFTNTNREPKLENEIQKHVSQGLGDMYEELPPRSIQPIFLEPVENTPGQTVRNQPVSVVPVHPVNLPRPIEQSMQPVIVTQPVSSPQRESLIPLQSVPITGSVQSIPVQRESFVPTQFSSPHPAEVIPLRPGVTPTEVNITPRSMDLVTVPHVLVPPVPPVYVNPIMTNEVVPLVVPPTSSPPVRQTISEIPPTPVEGPIIRGSRIALYYGNVFLQLFSQFLTNARMRFSQQPQPPLFN